jgi:glycosyltransferase involved in cell wall biosynthesis
MASIEKNSYQMNDPATSKQQFERLRVCVLIPTYNNSKTLAKTIQDVAEYTDQIIVINDGSTDDTANIIENFPFVKSLQYPVNKGKGWALRKGFAFALQLGFHYAISIDSDGQHFAHDLPLFIAKLETEKDAIIVGSRNMNQESVPGKSSFGYKFSNFWYRLETGIDAPDTQSGYRLYPIAMLQNIRFITRKYEFEIEVLVRAAWAGLQILFVPIAVYYPPKAERVSHFRPFTDFVRISILNTFLVLLTFLYIKPRNLMRKLFQKKKLSTLIHDQFFNAKESELLKAASIGFGVFMGIIPIWGFQLAVAIFLAILFKLNKALVIIAANISIPPMIPLIIYGSYKLGAYWMPNHSADIKFSNALGIDSIRYNLQQYIYGSVSLAVLAGIIFWIASYSLLKLFKRKPRPAI